MYICALIQVVHLLVYYNVIVCDFILKCKTSTGRVFYVILEIKTNKNQ